MPTDDFAEDDRIDEAEQLRDASESEREENQPAVGPEVGPENSHSALSSVTRCPAASSSAIARESAPWWTST